MGLNIPPPTHIRTGFFSSTFICNGNSSQIHTVHKCWEKRFRWEFLSNRRPLHLGYHQFETLGLWRLWLEGRLRRLGPFFLCRRRLHGGLIAAYTMFARGMDVDPALVLPTVRPDLWAQPLKFLQCPYGPYVFEQAPHFFRLSIHTPIKLDLYHQAWLLMFNTCH